MSCRMRLVGLLTVVLVGLAAPFQGDQSSRGAEWRRPADGVAEDPAILLQRAEDLIQRATEAAATARPQPTAVQPRPIAAASAAPAVDKPSIRLNDEPLVAPTVESPDETTIRLVINTPTASAPVPSDSYPESLTEEQSVPVERPANFGRMTLLEPPLGRIELAMVPQSVPERASRTSPPSPFIHAAPVATAAIENQQSRIASDRADYFEQAAFSSTDEEVVHAAEEELVAPPQPQPAPYLREGQSLVPYGPLDPTCSDACCPAPRPLFWVAGVEASFLWPDLNREGGTAFSFEDEGQYSAAGESSFSDAVDSMYLTPRIWLGVQGCKWGVNVRYWHLRACEGDFNPTTVAEEGWEYDEWAWDKTPDVGFFSDACLDAYTIDLEITRRFCLHDCAMQASFGVRHGSIENSESVVGTALGDDARFMSYAHSERYSRGTGIVMGLYGRKPLFPCSCVHWFYNARWSALWGPTGTAAETFAAVTIDDGNAGSVNGADTRVSDTLIIGEIQLGLEWNYALQCLPANAFLRAAVEYQRWDGGKGYSEAGSFATYSDDDGWSATANAFASAAEPQMDLVGITLGSGLTW